MDNQQVKKKKLLGKNIMGELGALIALVLLCIVMSILTPNFLTGTNLLNILVQITVISIIAAGMTFVVITGGIDLSVGSTVALCGLLLGIFMVNMGMPVWLSVAIVLVVGAVIGLINGVFISYLSLPPFIATLGTMSIVRGAAYTVTGGQPIYTFPKEFLGFASKIGGVFPLPILIMIIVFVIAIYIQKNTKLGRYCYAIGGSEASSILSGINVKAYKTTVYCILGFLCALASCILTARLDSAVSVAGDGYELDAIASVVIGGTSMSGGEGKIMGTIIGSLIMGVVSNGLNLLTVPTGSQRMIKGAIIIIAVLIDIYRRRKRS